MAWMLALVLVVLWLVGLVTSHVFGGLIHLLLGAALVTLVLRASRARRPKGAR
jgi:hypothetical protein